MNTREIVQRLWNLCHVLRDDGITYHQYVTELTYLLFLKMAEETGTDGQLPDGWRWADLERQEDPQRLTFYRKQLTHLGTHGSPRVQGIYADARTALRQPHSLATLVSRIGDLDWYSAQHEGLGDLYEGLLDKNAGEAKAGAGQYFTPRPLVECMVALTRPQPGEVVSDPAAGTLGFLVCADAYIKRQTTDLADLSQSDQAFQRRQAFHGVELVADTHRLGLMNAMLHGIEGTLFLGDSLSNLGRDLPASDVILTNPPFGTRGGGARPTRGDLTHPTSNKQLAFLQHIYGNLKPGGRAAVVVPDSVLFEERVGGEIRAELMSRCDLHTILRLPMGIFYAPGVTANVLFFRKDSPGAQGHTKEVWIYDMRTNVPVFGKRRPFTLEHLTPFMAAYGDAPDGSGHRVDEGEAGRFRRFSREHLRSRGDNLHITWLAEQPAALPQPEEIAGEILMRLQDATDELQVVVDLLRDGDGPPSGAHQ